MKVTRNKSDGVRRKTKAKNENRVQRLFCSKSCNRSIGIPSSESDTTQFLPTNYTQHVRIKPPSSERRLWASVLYLNLLCASISKMQPKIFASLLYAISAHRRSCRKALLSENRGNLYFGIWLSIENRSNLLPQTWKSVAPPSNTFVLILLVLPWNANTTGVISKFKGETAEQRWSYQI